MTTSIRTSDSPALTPSPRLDGLGIDALTRARSESDFSSVLGKASSAPGDTPERKARHAAEQFVATALVQPVLKQLRESNNAAPPFLPTSGEKQFQALFDTEIAQRMVRASNFPVVDSITKSLLKRLSAGATTSAFEANA